MTNLKATIHYCDERLKVLLSPALESRGERAQELSEPGVITLVSLVDDRMFEPAFFSNPHFILPVASERDHYIRFLQALRHSDQFAMATISGQSTEQTGLVYPSKNYLMFVYIRPSAELVEPEAPDWAAEAATLTVGDVALYKGKLERLKEESFRARSAETGR
jgi:hypothetical protein